VRGRFSRTLKASPIVMPERLRTFDLVASHHQIENHFFSAISLPAGRGGDSAVNGIYFVLSLIIPMSGTIRKVHETEFEIVYAIINAAAQTYRGIIPADRWKEPYMSKDELRHEINMGVTFWGYEEEGVLVGVMGIQHVQDVTLIRHAYVRPDKQTRGVGSKLLSFLQQQTTQPVLIGTWADATRAIAFYEKHGFQLVSPEEKDRLLKKYWVIPERQIETSIVLADPKWAKL
jgi:N-acetylglutamate synthase-like GNAT family acetyltransferase